MCSLNVRRFCEEWRIWIRPLLILTYVIFAIIVVPLLIVNSVKDGFSRRDQLILIGGLFVLSAVPVSIWHIIQHVIHFTKPILQKHIIRILWMVPIYALNAWIGLFFPAHSIYVDSLRECYEAYVIYNFMVYLLHYLNLGMDLEATMEYKPQVYHFFPLCCMRPWVMGREFIHNCKHGILQYTVVRPITTFISVICELCGVYGEGEFAGNVAFPYIIVINNISQFVAMYCLVLFYRANKEDLKPMKPLPKFLCIKAVVFFSFFQGVLLNMLVYYGVIEKMFGQQLGDANLLQNFLICIEMFLAAIAHIYSFPHHPFHINSPQYWNNPNHSWCRAFLSMMDISDMQEDVTEHFGVFSSSISRRFHGRSAYQPLARGPRRLSNESDNLINKRLDQQLPTSSSQAGNRGQGQGQGKYSTYGATSSRLIVPVNVCIEERSQQLNKVTEARTPSRFPLAGGGEAVGGIGGGDNNFQQQQLHLPGASNFTGIALQNTNVTSKAAAARQRDSQHLRERGGGGAGGMGGGDYQQLQFLGGVGPPQSGSSFLQARAAAAAVAAPIPDSNDDYALLMGAGAGR
ncbi:transmembrane protein 184C-like [Scaptodrosophila lebanonensis]|uniref:Transmembrane protein 184C-like n=1 Tax=Drosophila lebanonensis TaxID=7225 RepID=A0A6J2TJ72_DROLE|nr:transmembrane protein 184C-like [Scaptodrosophila lebanonensis]